MAISMIALDLAEQLSGIPPQLATTLIAALPIVELRGALPVALELWNLPAWQAYAFSVLGNCLPLIPLFFGLAWLRKGLLNVWPSLVKPIDWYIDRSHQKLKSHYETYGALALFFFTAIPLPLTGLYTATVAAVALKIPLKQAGPAIVAGVLVSGLLMLIITKSVVTLT